MYRATATYDGTETVIHNSKMNTSANIKGGTLKEGVNSFPTFSFVIYPNNPGYDTIENLLTMVKLTNIKTSEDEFVGRVYSISDVMTGDGLVCKSVICEGELAYLQDVIISSKSFSQGTLLSTALDSLFTTYNNTVSNSKKIQFDGSGTVGLPAAYDAEYKSAFDILKDLCDMCGWEFYLYYSNGTRYVGVASEISNNSSTEISLSINLKSFQREVSTKDLVTRFYPLGIVKSTGAYFTIAPDNQGRPYLQDSELYNKYGLIEASRVYDKITIESNESIVAGAKKLKARAVKDYAKMIALTKSFSISAVDLSLINGNYDQLRLYGNYRVITKLQNIDEKVRITGRTLKIDEPYNPTFVFGQKEITLTSMMLEKQ